MLTVYASKNTLGTFDQPYVIRSCCSDMIDQSELIDIMAKGRTTLSKPDIIGCLQLFAEELISLVSDGKHVKTPVGSFYLSAGGKLDTVNQPFNPGEGTLEHALTLHFRPNKMVESTMISRARWERVENFDQSASAVESVAVIGRTGDGTAQAGDSVRLVGRRMKFDSSDVECGIFLETEVVRVRLPKYLDIAPSKIIAVLPGDVATGSYDLLVATKPNGKDIKEGYYQKQLVIA